MGARLNEVGSRTGGHELAILGYHKIGEPSPGGWSTWNYVPETTFAGHLRCLETLGWRVIGLEQLLAGLSDPESLPERAALITFDDGYRSVRERALPILERFGCPAILFVPTAYIGKTNTFDEGVEPREAICDWEDLRALERSRVSIQSHGISHRHFSEMDAREQKRELVKSRAALETGLGTTVSVFAYPFGDDGLDPPAVGHLVAGAGYRAACLYGGGAIRVPPPDRYRLERLAIGPDTDLESALRGS